MVGNCHDEKIHCYATGHFVLVFKTEKATELKYANHTCCLKETTNHFIVKTSTLKLFLDFVSIQAHRGVDHMNYFNRLIVHGKYNLENEEFADYMNCYTASSSSWIDCVWINAYWVHFCLIYRYKCSCNMTQLEISKSGKCTLDWLWHPLV